MMLLPWTPDAGSPDNFSIEFFRVFLVEKHAPTELDSKHVPDAPK